MKLKELFHKTELNYKKVILFAIISGIYTALMALIPIFKDTSFADLTISFEVWILFGIFIIMNSESAKDSALKCFIFFLISQPLVYLIQVPFSSMGFGILNYYKNWIVWTILTLPMGYIGYYMKKDKWWGLLILVPILIFLGYHYSDFLKKVIYMFPHHLLSTLFCTLTLFLYPIVIFKNKAIKKFGLFISTIIFVLMSIYALINKIEYTTELLASDENSEIVFDDSSKVYLENSKIGNVSIKNDDGTYVVEGYFKKGGKTNLIIEDINNNKIKYELYVGYNEYKLNNND